MGIKSRKEIADKALTNLQSRLEEGSKAIQDALSQLQPRKGRGGAREGAGRPIQGKSAATERVIFRLTKDEKKLLEQQKEEGESIHQTARRVLLESCKSK